MLSTLVALVALQSPAVGADRYDMGVRLKELDAAWMKTPRAERRREAVPRITGAVTGFFSGRFGDAARALDSARAALEGREPTNEDAITFRFDPPVVEPGGTAKLAIGWAYPGPEPGRAVEVAVAGRTVTVAPGRTAALEIPARSLARGEADVWVEVRANGVRRRARLSVVRDAERRIAALAESSTVPPASFLRNALQGPVNGETDVALLQQLRQAESTQKNPDELFTLEQVLFTMAGRTPLRAAFPRSLRGKKDVPATVVIALHGAGGSENLFFEGYGNGIAVSEALRRGWVFLSPRSTPTGARDALAWLSDVRKLTPERVLVMGHSMGGGLALGTGSLEPAPTAVALFAPAAREVPENLKGVPIYLAVGAQELAMLRTGAERIGGSFAGDASRQFERFDPCEHLMIVADAVPNAYRFFDRRLR